MDEPHRSIRKIRLQDEGKDDDLKGTTAEERLAMMWQLALDAWAFKGESVPERMPRHITRVIRGRDAD